FIALYLGSTKPPPLRLGSQFATLLSIWIDRDDRDVIERYRANTIVIDTEPVGTIDFDLTNEEKDFLVLIGRISALEFLGTRNVLDPDQLSSIPALKAEAENSRAEIRKKRLSRWGPLKTVLLLVAGTLAAAAVGLAILVVPGEPEKR